MKRITKKESYINLRRDKSVDEIRDLLRTTDTYIHNAHYVLQTYSGKEFTYVLELTNSGLTRYYQVTDRSEFIAIIDEFHSQIQNEVFY